MLVRSHLAAIAAAALFAAAPAVAQAGDSTPSLTVNPGVLTKGGSANVSYTNPAMAGQTVVIDIDNGMRNNPQYSHVEIHLDANGCGTAVWAVPNWYGANFNAPGVGEVFCPIV